MEQLSGTVSRVVYRQPDGYAVVELSGSADKPTPVVGRLLGVQAGDHLEVRGRWTQHRRFGRQFRVERFSAAPPNSEDGLLKYLSSGAVDGIGPSIAGRLVEHFGREIFDVAAEQPQRLTEVAGIGKRRAAALATTLAQQRNLRSQVAFLHELGVGTTTASRIWQRWGERSAVEVRRDPYQLVSQVDGIGFVKADAIAEKLGVEGNHPSRLSAGVVHLLRSAADAGDTVRLREEIITGAARFLDADEPAVEGAVDSLLQAERIAELDAVDVEACDGRRLGLRWLVDAEQRIAAHVRRLTANEIELSGDLQELKTAQLTEEQLQAVSLAARGPVAIITGGPGTGKTTILCALVAALRRQNERVYLCAPTGRAAKRLAEATGEAATTIHRLLGFSGGQFSHGPDNALAAGTVIVDEASMVDVPLMMHLLDALSEGSRLVLVGDQDQLPSVGPGNVLADLIASDHVPVVKLSRVFRQARDSQIVQNAHRIRQGRLPVGSTDSQGQFHFLRVSDAQSAQEMVLRLCVERMPQAFGLDPIRDIQVLSPMHRGEAGTTALNNALQARLNPHGMGLERPGRDSLRVGDKVMQVRNDYDRDVFNGDIGVVVAVNAKRASAQVAINDRIVSYQAKQLDQLSLAYCVSIHKSQGSEYPAVVIPLLTQHYVLLQRNLLYTAVTRAKQLAIIVGSERALKLAVERVDQSARQTTLAHVLRDDGLSYALD